ncbi:MAG: hypothetical protein K0S34_2067 [Bacillales bacterium]|nr:hypothetical protein [Bacillales bacterium]
MSGVGAGTCGGFIVGASYAGFGGVGGYGGVGGFGF